MSGFFEKRITTDIAGRVRAAWPGVVVSVVPSDYNPDGLCIRINVDDDLFVDTTIHNARWSAFIGADGPNLRIVPGDRHAIAYPLSVGAPPAQVAPAIVDFMRSQWTAFAELKRELTASDTEGDERNLAEVVLAFERLTDLFPVGVRHDASAAIVKIAVTETVKGRVRRDADGDWEAVFENGRRERIAVLPLVGNPEGAGDMARGVLLGVCLFYVRALAGDYPSLGRDADSVTRALYPTAVATRGLDAAAATVIAEVGTVVKILCRELGEADGFVAWAQEAIFSVLLRDMSEGAIAVFEEQVRGFTAALIGYVSTSSHFGSD